METVSSTVKIYIDFSFTLYTSNFADAAAVQAAATKALSNMTRKINMPIKEFRADILEENGGVYKTAIEAQTVGRAGFEDYERTYAWRDMVHDIADHTFTRWKLKAQLLINKFPNNYSFVLHQTGDSDIAGYSASLNW